MDTLIFILFIVAVIGITAWQLYFCRMARETRELSKLNRIWERYNNKQATAIQTRSELNRHTWRYRVASVKLLREFTYLLDRPL